jgi:hypothetical protein
LSSTVSFGGLPPFRCKAPYSFCRIDRTFSKVPGFTPYSRLKRTASVSAAFFPLYHAVIIAFLMLLNKSIKLSIVFLNFSNKFWFGISPNVPAVYEIGNFAGLSHCGCSYTHAISFSYNELALLARGN